uniref:Mitochondrial ribosomal protein S18C n=1 Tax=Bos indicus x Bos taurus TaxID=30522 RepID=A0A4W2GD81_BOBOX
MAAMVALCSGLGKRKLTRFTTAVVCLINPGIHAVLWRSCSQYKQFISPFTGCIYGRHITGLCGNKQKEITKAIKRAQISGFMPITYKDPAYLKDPKVCNIKYRE